MRVIARRTLQLFWEQHADAEGPLCAWFKEAERADWTGPDDIKRRYATASFIGGERVVFNIGGNKYRLVVLVRYPFHIIYIRFVGTHAEYDRINVESI